MACISSAMHGKARTAGGFIWRKVERENGELMAPVEFLVDMPVYNRKGWNDKLLRGFDVPPVASTATASVTPEAAAAAAAAPLAPAAPFGSMQSRADEADGVGADAATTVAPEGSVGAAVVVESTEGPTDSVEAAAVAAAADMIVQDASYAEVSTAPPEHVAQSRENAESGAADGSGPGE